MIRSIIGWALIAFAAYYLLTNPDGADGNVHGVLDGLRSDCQLRVPVRQPLLRSKT